MSPGWQSGRGSLSKDYAILKISHLGDWNFEGPALFLWYGTDVEKKTTTTQSHWQTHHFIRNMSSPLESVAPIIRSGSKPRAKPRGFSDCKNQRDGTILTIWDCPPDWGHSCFSDNVIKPFCQYFTKSLALSHKPFRILLSDYSIKF